VATGFLTIAEALRQGTEILSKASVDPARFTAELLLMHALQKDRVYLFTHALDPLTELAWIHYGRYLHERSQGKPVQYILGKQEFFYRDFHVEPGVLIPRHETEHLIEFILDLPRPIGRILDAGCGSGAIAVTLAAELKRQILAVDRSPIALRVSRGNAERHGANVHFYQGDWLSAVAPQSLDLLVSNPPYIALTDKAGLQREVRDYEPELALFAGQDGNAAYRILEPQARQVLKPGGRIVLEIGNPNAADLFAAWHDVRILPDLSGRACVLTAVL
jgi:release factor glutamine methyltransferase